MYILFKLWLFLIDSVIQNWRRDWRDCACVALAVCVLAFPDEVDHLIQLFLLVVEVQRLHAALEVGRGETFRPVTHDQS